ncbi:MAG: flavodoxin domain-containing protein, partial [Bacteroidales bacterium]
KKAPVLNELHYSVIALGDSSYKQFCKTGKDIDTVLEKLGAQRLYQICLCDLNYEETATLWLESVLPLYKEIVPKNERPALPVDLKSDNQYDKRNPYPAQLLERIQLNGRGSDKQTYHIELNIEGSGIQYSVGDALGVVCKNDKAVVHSLLEYLKFNANTIIQYNKKDIELAVALEQNFEITMLTPHVVTKYAELTNNRILKELTENETQLRKYLYQRDVLDLLTEYKADITPQDLVSILRPLTPRLYSISSSPLANEGEVHITVGLVNYQYNNRTYSGVCSSFLANRLQDDEPVHIYIDKNEKFRLPQDPSTPIIMIGPGTGVAPFRAFVQEREYLDIKSKSWLFFGDRHFTTDFLYQEEWLQHLKNGSLTRMDVAFSRDQKEKQYVQHKMWEQRKDFFRWLEAGAVIYVCGDKQYMAKDVKRMVYQIIAKEGCYSDEIASEYFQNLIQNNRYIEDVY